MTSWVDFQKLPLWKRVWYEFLCFVPSMNQFIQINNLTNCMLDRLNYLAILWFALYGSYNFTLLADFLLICWSRSDVRLSLKTASYNNYWRPHDLPTLRYSTYMPLLMSRINFSFPEATVFLNIAPKRLKVWRRRVLQGQSSQGLRLKNPESLYLAFVFWYGWRCSWLYFFCVRDALRKSSILFPKWYKAITVWLWATCWICN